MKKLLLFIFILFLAGLILIGGSCGDENGDEEDGELNSDNAIVVLSVGLSENATKSTIESHLADASTKGSFKIKKVAVDESKVKYGDRISGSFTIEYALPSVKGGYKGEDSWRISISAINLTDENGNKLTLSTNEGSLGNMKGLGNFGEETGYFIIPTSGLSLGTHKFYIEVKADQVAYNPTTGHGTVIYKFEDKESFATAKVIKVK